MWNTKQCVCSHTNTPLYCPHWHVLFYDDMSVPKRGIVPRLGEFGNDWAENTPKHRPTPSRPVWCSAKRQNMFLCAESQKTPCRVIQAFLLAVCMRSYKSMGESTELSKQDNYYRKTGLIIDFSHHPPPFPPMYWSVLVLRMPAVVFLYAYYGVEDSVLNISLL